LAHRGKHPEDDKLFSATAQITLREAVSDLSFLLSKGYGDRSAGQLVGNRYTLTARQMQAMWRMSAAKQSIVERQKKEIKPEFLKGKNIEIDGYNILIITEVALSGGYIFEGLDHCYRDIAGIHGTYKKVEETLPALRLIGNLLQQLEIAHVQWFFDAPVSNSGRLKGILYELAVENGFPWDIELVNSPDKTLVERNGIVVSSDAWILDNVDNWSNLIRYVIDKAVPNALIVNY
jgi:hypothetical protein